MIVLTGSNLGERQRELNAKVKEATTNHVDFNQIKDTDEKSDVDKLFKIDLASNYANIDYIIDILKSGDSFYITRALKCDWIYDADYSNIINTDYLHKNVIPFMSLKMKKKLLTVISAHVRDETRATEFYKYCMDIKDTNIALKFFNFTSHDFKLELLKDNERNTHLVAHPDSDLPRHFVGTSFDLAETYVKLHPEKNRLQVFRVLSYLYLISEEKYLNLLEKYVELTPYSHCILGVRVSRCIMKKHKDRVLKVPEMYVRILNRNIVAKYTTQEDAKIYIAAVLPDNVETFWNTNFCNKYRYILDKIIVGKFDFLKQAFTAKYPEQYLETNVIFYYKQFYKIMTTAEQEAWALQLIASENEILGIGKDYIWYKFVNFDRAFEDVKKLIMITPDNSKRAEIMLILVESAKNDRDMEILLKYFYDRHINEQKFVKENFLDRVMHHFNVYKFNEACWSIWDKIFHSLDVYSMTDYRSKSEYRIVALVYHIINQIDVPEALKKHFDSEMQFYALKLQMNRLSTAQIEMVFHYLFEFYMVEIRKFETVPYNDDVKCSVRKYIYFILDLLIQFDRTKDDCPELVLTFIQLDWSEFECHSVIREDSNIDEAQLDLAQDLKKDAKLLVQRLPMVQKIMKSGSKCDISIVLKKLRTYFSNDIAKDYLEFFEKILNEKELWLKQAESVAHGIFQLAENSYKVDFLLKYAPTVSTIDQSKIDPKLFRIQQAICGHACYSRPPLPHKYVLLYIKGDYVHFCLPMFNSYLANLPLPLCLEFVEALLDTPISIQKHGIRLAFQCFNAETLNTLVIRTWNKTRNVSLRLIIFKALFHKVIKKTDCENVLFDTMKTISLTLGPDDEEEIYRLLLSNHVRGHLVSDCIEIAWRVVSKFSFKPTNLKRMRTVIICMIDKIHLMRHEILHSVVNQFIGSVFIQQEEYAKKPTSEEIALIDAKWKLTASYVINVQNENELDKKLEITKFILNKCLNTQGIGLSDKRVLRKTCFNFIRDLENKSYNQDYRHYKHANKIIQLVLDTLLEILAIEEIYLEVWLLRLGMLARKVIADGKLKLEVNDNVHVTKDIAKNLANELGNLIKEFIEKGLYFNTFSSDIQNEIVKAAQTVKDQLSTKDVFADMMINVCLEMMSFDITEIYLLVLNLLPPSTYLKYEEYYKYIIREIMKIDNKEIKCNLYRNLVTSELDLDAFK